MAETLFWNVAASDLLKFVSELVAALAWPLATAFIVYLFKNEIIARIPFLEEASIAGQTFKFRHDLDKVEESVTARPAPALAVPADDEQGPVQVLPPPENLDADTAPTRKPEPEPEPAEAASPYRPEPASTDLEAGAVIRRAWHKLDNELRVFARSLGIDGNMVRGSIDRLIDTLHEHQAIDDDEVQEIRSLNNLRKSPRNIKANLTRDDASRFEHVAGLLALRFHLKRTLPRKEKSIPAPV